MTTRTAEPSGQWYEEFGKVTRVEVIENSERAYTIYGAENVKTALQDDGRTLKVFLNKDRP